MKKTRGRKKKQTQKVVEDSDSDEDYYEQDNAEESFDDIGTATGRQGLGILGFDSFSQAQ